MNKNNNEELKNSIYTEDSLSLLNIKDLRDMGRKIGVPSPTTKNKQELVDYILKIIFGEIEAPARSVYGRPNVREFDMNKCLYKIQKNSVVKPESFKLVLNSAGFETKLSSPTAAYDTENIEQRVFVKNDAGLFLKLQAFIDSETDIKISNEIAKKYKLENFDMVETCNNDKGFKIISINGVKVETKIDYFIVNHTKVEGGTSHIFNFDTKEEIDNEINKLKETCNKNNIKMYKFSTQETTEICDNLVCYDESEGESGVYKKLMYFVSICEKKALDGEEFVMMINRIDIIEDALKSFEQDVYERIKKHLQETIDKIVSFGNVSVSFNLDKVITY